MDKAYLNLLSKWCEENGLPTEEDEFFNNIGYNLDEDSIGLVFETDYNHRYNMYVNLALKRVGLYHVVEEDYYGGAGYDLGSSIIREDLCIEGLELIKSWFASNTDWTSMPMPEE